RRQPRDADAEGEVAVGGVVATAVVGVPRRRRTVGAARAELVELLLRIVAEPVEDPRRGQPREAHAAAHPGEHALPGAPVRRLVDHHRRWRRRRELDRHRDVAPFGEAHVAHEGLLAGRGGLDLVGAGIQREILAQGAVAELDSAEADLGGGRARAALDAQARDPCAQLGETLDGLPLDEGEPRFAGVGGRQLVVAERRHQLPHVLLAQGYVEEDLRRGLHLGDLLEEDQGARPVARGLQGEGLLELLPRRAQLGGAGLRSGARGRGRVVGMRCLARVGPGHPAEQEQDRRERRPEGAVPSRAATRARHHLQGQHGASRSRSSIRRARVFLYAFIPTLALCALSAPLERLLPVPNTKAHRRGSKGAGVGAEATAVSTCTPMGACASTRWATWPKVPPWSSVALWAPITIFSALQVKARSRMACEGSPPRTCPITRKFRAPMSGTARPRSRRWRRTAPPPAHWNIPAPSARWP